MTYQQIMEAAIPGARITYQSEGREITSRITGYPLERRDKTYIPVDSGTEIITFLIETADITSIGTT